jgi:hypothetical protein
MQPLKLIETRPGHYSLLLDAGTTAVDDLAEELGHEPNGYFWEGVTRWLLATEAPHLNGRLGLDPEAGMFVAYGEDRPALEDLGTRLSAVATDPARLRDLVTQASAAGFDFDD